MREQYDIGIVGGGMVGASLAVALGRERAGVALIESVPPRSSMQPSYDDRGLALSFTTCAILERLGLWSEVSSAANPIRRIHVSEQGRFGCVRLDAGRLGLDALGHVVIARLLGNALYQALARVNNVDMLCPARVESVSLGRRAVTLVIAGNEGRRSLRCRLLVVADGTGSSLRSLLGIGVCRRDYGQSALVANASPARHHEDTAYERFSPEGPLALLPLRDGQCVAVLAVRNPDLEAYTRLGAAEFLARLNSRFGRRLGGFNSIGARRSYPLTLVRAKQQVLDRVVLLGNAAHTIHPNGAQGFNLALRDVAGLAEQLSAALAAGEDPGKRRILDAYLNERRADQERVIRFSDNIARLYYNEQCAKMLVRNAVLLLTSLLPPLDRVLSRYGTGLIGRQPAWVREAALP